MLLLKEVFVLKKLKKDLLIVVLLIILPFAFFVHKMFPETQVWRNSWFTLDSGVYENVKLFIWTLMLKILTLSLLSLWFLTCKYIWRYVLFVPIIAEIYKILVWLKVFEFDIKYIPESYESLIFSIPYLIILLLLSNILGYYKNPKSNMLNDEINNQIIKLSKFDVKKFKLVRKELVRLINKKKNMSKKEYLLKLIALRDQISV